MDLAPSSAPFGGRLHSAECLCDHGDRNQVNEELPIASEEYLSAYNGIALDLVRPTLWNQMKRRYAAAPRAGLVPLLGDVRRPGSGIRTGLLWLR